MAPAYYNGLRRQVTSLGLERHVIFTGYREDALRVLSQLDVLVLPALFGEGLPIVILEAMALAKPVVATRVEGISEVVRDAETGVLVAPGDASALSQAILTMIRNRELAGQMGTRGHERFLHEFTADVMARKVEPVYRYVLGGDHRPGSREPRRD
jgi:glycosyltransferase involved in cell wall biosynthesis